MIFERVISEWLAHYSYFIGDAGTAAVVDPRRDVDVYLDLARKHDLEIRYIFETHRNEDYVIGSAELSRRTGAQVLRSAHSPLTYKYGTPIETDQTISLGNLQVKTLHTPGHTLGHMAYVLMDHSHKPWMIFTGDALFAGDIGRTDFYGEEQLPEMTGKLYDSIFEKIIPYGDEIILCPAHGAGSVCGAAIADRVWTTTGIERDRNIRLQFTKREEFIANNGSLLPVPPYFKQVERLNVDGSPDVLPLKQIPGLNPAEFQNAVKDGQIVDLRDEMSFGAGFIQGSFFLWQKLLCLYSGWVLDMDKPIYLVLDNSDIQTAQRQLYRLGFDNIAGYLSGGIKAWIEAGLPTEQIGTLSPHELNEQKTKPWILDIRSEKEKPALGEIKSLQTHGIDILELTNRKDEIPNDQPVAIFCGTGARSMLAASILKQNGFDQLNVVLGGIVGWNKI